MAEPRKNPFGKKKDSGIGPWGLRTNNPNARPTSSRKRREQWDMTNKANLVWEDKLAARQRAEANRIQRAEATARANEAQWKKQFKEKWLEANPNVDPDEIHHFTWNADGTGKPFYKEKESQGFEKGEDGLWSEVFRKKDGSLEYRDPLRGDNTKTDPKTGGIYITDKDDNKQFLGTNKEIQYKAEYDKTLKQGNAIALNQKIQEDKADLEANNRRSDVQAHERAMAHKKKIQKGYGETQKGRSSTSRNKEYEEDLAKLNDLEIKAEQAERRKIAQQAKSINISRYIQRIKGLSEADGLESLLSYSEFFQNSKGTKDGLEGHLFREPASGTEDGKKTKPPKPAKTKQGNLPAEPSPDKSDEAVTVQAAAFALETDTTVQDNKVKILAREAENKPNNEEAQQKLAEAKNKQATRGPLVSPRIRSYMPIELWPFDASLTSLLGGIEEMTNADSANKIAVGVAGYNGANLSEAKRKLQAEARSFTLQYIFKQLLAELGGDHLSAQIHAYLLMKPDIADTVYSQPGEEGERQIGGASPAWLEGKMPGKEMTRREWHGQALVDKKAFEQLWENPSKLSQKQKKRIATKLSRQGYIFDAPINIEPTAKGFDDNIDIDAFTNARKRLEEHDRQAREHLKYEWRHIEVSPITGLGFSLRLAPDAKGKPIFQYKIDEKLGNAFIGEGKDRKANIKTQTFSSWDEVTMEKHIDLVSRELAVTRKDVGLWDDFTNRLLKAFGKGLMGMGYFANRLRFKYKDDSTGIKALQEVTKMFDEEFDRQFPQSEASDLKARTSQMLQVWHSLHDGAAQLFLFAKAFSASKVLPKSAVMPGTLGRTLTSTKVGATIGKGIGTTTGLAVKGLGKVTGSKKTMEIGAGLGKGLGRFGKEVGGKVGAFAPAYGVNLSLTAEPMYRGAYDAGHIWGTDNLLLTASGIAFIDSLVDLVLVGGAKIGPRLLPKGAYDKMIASEKGVAAAIAISVGSRALAEGSTEWVQTAWENKYAIKHYDPTRDWKEGTFVSFVVGTLLGGGMGLRSAPSIYRQRMKNAEDVLRSAEGLKSIEDALKGGATVREELSRKTGEEITTEDIIDAKYVFSKTHALNSANLLNIGQARAEVSSILANVAHLSKETQEEILDSLARGGDSLYNAIAVGNEYAGQTLSLSVENVERIHRALSLQGEVTLAQKDTAVAAIEGYIFIAREAEYILENGKASRDKYAQALIDTGIAIQNEDGSMRVNASAAKVLPENLAKRVRADADLEARGEKDTNVEPAMVGETTTDTSIKENISEGRETINAVAEEQLNTPPLPEWQIRIVSNTDSDKVTVINQPIPASSVEEAINIGDDLASQEGAPDYKIEVSPWPTETTEQADLPELKPGKKVEPTEEVTELQLGNKVVSVEDYRSSLQKRYAGRDPEILTRQREFAEESLNSRADISEASERVEEQIKIEVIDAELANQEKVTKVLDNINKELKEDYDFFKSGSDPRTERTWDVPKHIAENEYTDLKLLTEKDLKGKYSNLQKQANDFDKLGTGRKIIFVRGGRDSANGAVDYKSNPDYLFINADAVVDPSSTIHHENLHTIEFGTEQEQKLYKEFRKKVDDIIPESEFGLSPNFDEIYKNSFGTPEGLASARESMLQGGTSHIAKEAVHNIVGDVGHPNVSSTPVDGKITYGTKDNLTAEQINNIQEAYVDLLAKVASLRTQTEQASDLTDDQRTTLDEEQVAEEEEVARQTAQAEREAVEDEAGIRPVTKTGEFATGKPGTEEFGQDKATGQNRSGAVDIKDDQETIQKGQLNVPEDTDPFPGSQESVRQREEEKEEESVQEEDAPSEVLEEKPAPKRRRDSRVKELFESDYFIEAIINSGGLISETTYRKNNSKEAFERNKSLWNGKAYLKGNPQFNGIYNPDGGMMPDQMHQILASDMFGFIKPDDSLGEMWEQIDKAAQSATSIAKHEAEQEKGWAKDERLAKLPIQLKTPAGEQVRLVESLNREKPQLRDYVPVDVDDVDGRINLPFVFALEQRTGRQIILMQPSSKDDTRESISGVVHKGAMLINLDGHYATLATTLHEFMHTVEKVNPELYEEFKEVVKKNARHYPELITPIAKRYHSAYDGDTNPKFWDKIESEAMANIAGDLAMDPKFWDIYLATQPKLSEKFVRAFMKFIDGLLNKIRRTPRKGRTWETVDAIEGLDEVRVALAKVLTESENFHRTAGNGSVFPALAELKQYALDPAQDSFDFTSEPARKKIDQTQQQLFNFESSKKKKRKTPLRVEDPSPPVKTGEIKDFGQKIGGARKDVYEAYKEKMESYVGEDVDITLSKNFPIPNYKQLLKEGVSLETLASIAAIRDSIPAKPKGKYKLRKWADAFRSLRKIANDLLINPDSEIANGWKKVIVNESSIKADKNLRVSANFIKRNKPLSDYDLARKANLPPDVVAKRELLKIARKTLLYRALGLPDFTKAKRWSIGYFTGLHYDENGEPLDNPKSGFVAKYNGKVRPSSPKSFKTDAEGATMEIADQIKRVMRIEGDPEVEMRRRKDFLIYKSRVDQSFEIAKKVGRNIVTLKEGFKDVPSAREYFKNQFDEIEAIWEEKKNVKLRGEDNRPREGDKLRKPNENIDPDQFMSRFGFRGVEFGNYVGNKLRQKNLNETYDALNDLASVLNIPVEALALNGTLALAFGARGHGGVSPASAHYEAIKIAINLTKKRGAGSLAHEWFHGLDNYFNKLNLRDKTEIGADGFITENITTTRYPSAVNMREEVRDAFKDLMQSILGSDYQSRAKKLDETRREPYYSENLELAARAFEAYIIDKLAQKGITNDFLANIDPSSSAYPSKQELAETYSPLFDKLFEGMRYEQTDRGTKLYALDPIRDPVLEEAAKGLEDGTVTNEEYRNLVQDRQPFVIVGPPEGLPDEDEFKNELIKERGTDNKRLFVKPAGKVGLINTRIEDGTPVEVRIDIGVFNKSKEMGLPEPMYVSTVHKPVKGKSIGKVVSYLPYSYVESPTFKSDREKALIVAKGKAKFPLATVVGTHKNIDSIPEGIENWNEVGYDPTRSSEFIDIKTGLPVISGKNALSIGNRVYVEDAQLMPQQEFDKPYKETKLYALDPETDSRYLELAKNPEQNYQELARLLDMAADKAGYKNKGWHGTPDGRFLDIDPVFRPREWADTGVHWFAKDYRTAATYADDTRAFDYQNAEPRLDPYYIKIENPYTVDGKGAKWRSTQGMGRTRNVVAKALDDGNDGIIIKNVRDDHQTGVVKGDKPTTTYAVFESEQIKTARAVTYDNDGNIVPLSQRFDPDKEDIRFALDPVDDPYYSGVIKAIEEEFPKTATLDQALAFLRPRQTKKGNSIKKAEVLWMGLNDAVPEMLDEKGKVTKEQLLIEAKKNQFHIRMKEVDRPEYGGEGTTQPGGTNYRELVFYAPEKQFTDRGHAQGRKYKGNHFQSEASNIIFHIRISDRRNIDGEPVLFIEEIQSDWGAAYNAYVKRKKKNASKLSKIGEKLRKAGREYRDKYKEWLEDTLSDEQLEHIEQHQKLIRHLEDRYIAELTQYPSDLMFDQNLKYTKGTTDWKVIMATPLSKLDFLLGNDAKKTTPGIQPFDSSLNSINENIERLLNAYQDRFKETDKGLENEIAEDLEEDLLGKEINKRVINIESGEVIISPRSKITKTQLRKLVKSPHSVKIEDAPDSSITSAKEKATLDFIEAFLRGATASPGASSLYSYIIKDQIKDTTRIFNKSYSEDYTGEKTADPITDIDTILKEYALANDLTQKQAEDYFNPLPIYPVAQALDKDSANPLYDIDRLKEAHQDLTDEKRAIDKTNLTEVEFMPFVRSYHEPALKHILRLAVENNYAGISWATGAQQIELYNSSLRKNVSEIQFEWESGPLQLENEIADALANVLLGKKLDVDITNSESGKVIIPAKRKITKTQLWKLAEQRSSIEIDLKKSINYSSRSNIAKTLSVIQDFRMRGKRDKASETLSGPRKSVAITVIEKHTGFDADAEIQPNFIGVFPLEGEVDRPGSGQIHGKTLNELVGKAIADQIREKVAEKDVEATGVRAKHIQSIKGDNLSIGGQLHKMLYDIATPKFYNKYTKQFNGEVGKKDIGFDEGPMRGSMEYQLGNLENLLETDTDDIKAIIEGAPPIAKTPAYIEGQRLLSALELVEEYKKLRVDIKNEQDQVMALPDEDRVLDIERAVFRVRAIRKIFKDLNQVYSSWFPVNITEAQVPNLDAHSYAQLRKRYDPHGHYYNSDNIIKKTKDAYEVREDTNAQKWDEHLTAYIADISVPLKTRTSVIKPLLEKANDAYNNRPNFKKSKFTNSQNTTKYYELNMYLPADFDAGIKLEDGSVNKSNLHPDEQAVLDALQEVADPVRTYDILLEHLAKLDPQLHFENGLNYLEALERLLSNAVEGDLSTLNQPYLQITPEMKNIGVEGKHSQFALDPVEGKKLASVKDKGEFTKTLARAPSGAILSAYDYIPASEENKARMVALGDKVEEILKPVEDPNPVSSNFKKKLATHIGKMIREGQPKQIVEDLIRERERLENYGGHPDLLAKVQDREYEEAVMRRPKPVEKTKRQQNFINLYNKYKDNPKSPYFKAASKALEKDFGKDWKNIAEGIEPVVGDTRYALDPENLSEDYEAKKAQQARATAELLDTRRKVKKAKKEEKAKKRKERTEDFLQLRRKIFSGKYDYLNFMSGLHGGSGKSGDVLRNAELQVAKVKRAVEDYSDKLSREIKKLVGVPAWRILAKAKRLREFSAEIHTTAARLNVESYNPGADVTENKFNFRGFDARMGFMSESEAKARGVAKGSYITEKYEGNTYTLKLGNYVPEMEGYLIVQHFTAEDQQKIYTDFLNKYPDLGIILVRFINPLLANSRHHYRGIKTPIFNRESLKQVFGDAELGDPGFVEGYTPDVAITTLLGAGFLKAKEAAERNPNRKRLGAFNLKTSGARNVKTGAAREKGQTLNIFEGFDVRALEAHLEKTSRENAYKLIEASTKPLPEDGLPHNHIEISKGTLNGILKGMLMVMGDRSARGTSLNKFWQDAVQNPNLSSYQEKVLFNETEAKYDEREKKILEFLFGDKNASRFIGKDRIIDKPTYEELINNLAARHHDYDWVARAVQTVFSQVISGYLTGFATILFNWLAPNLQSSSAGIFRINKAAIYLGTGFTNPENRRRAEYELRAGIQTLKGLVTRRFSNWNGIDFLLTGEDYLKGKLSEADYDKGAFKLIKEGQFGKALKALTDRNHKYGEIINRERFDNNTLVSGIERVEPKDSIVKDLLNLKGGSAMLKVAQFHEMDPTVKQNLEYAAYKAHAQMAYNDAVREAKAKGQKITTPKKKWIREWMKNVKDDSPIHEEARGTAMLFAFDYSNIPMWLDSKHPLMQSLKPSFFTFSNFIYNYGKLLINISPLGMTPKLIKSKGKKDALGGAEWRNAASGFSMFAMATLLYQLLGDDDDKESSLESGKVGKNVDISNKLLKKFWVMTGGKINLDQMPDIFGEKITNSIRAYFEAYGAEDAVGHELWLRGRALPYLNMLATQDLWVDALKDWTRGEEGLSFRDVFTETRDMAMEFVPRGPVMALLTENKYDENKTQAEEYAGLTFDIATSRMIFPSTYWKFAQRLTDPIARRKWGSEPFKFNETGKDQFLNEWKRSIPLLSRTVMPAGSIKTLKLDDQTESGDEFVKTTTFDHAMIQREDVKADLLQLASMGVDLSEATLIKPNDDGVLQIKYPDPATVRIVTPAERIVNWLFRIEAVNPIEKAVAMSGVDDYRAMDRLIGKAFNKPNALTDKDRQTLEAWSKYTQSSAYRDSIRNNISAEGSLAERLQEEEEIAGLPVTKDDDGKEISPPSSFLRKVVENMYRDQYGRLTDLDNERPINLKLTKHWMVVPENENVAEGSQDPMDYVLKLKKDSTTYKDMIPYDKKKGFKFPFPAPELEPK